MKFICLGYLDVPAWTKRSESEQNAMIDACMTYDEELKRTGHWAGGEGLAGPDQAATLRLKGGEVQVTDGPYAETKELLGGVLILEAADRAEAIRLISRHPGTKMGPWQVLPTIDMTPMIRASEERRAKAKSK